MSAPKPGPWRVTWNEDEGHMVEADNGKGVAMLYQTDEPTAHLISAAPEMLAALQGFFKLIDDGMLCRDTSRDHEPEWVMRSMDLVVTLKLAKDAIAKAVQS